MNLAVESTETQAPAPEILSVVERLAGLRSAAQRRRYPGPTPQLPSRRSILAMSDDLLGAIYPRHLGVRDLGNGDLDRYVEQALQRAAAVLEYEAALELSLGEQGLASGGAAGFAAQVLESLPHIRETVDLDIRASLAADPQQGSFDELVFCSPGVAAILRHRLAHELYELGVPLMAKIVAEDCRARTGVDIHPAVEIGEGFSIAGAAGLAIGETAIIGRNVRIHTPATLGESFSIATDDGAPVVALAAASISRGARRHPRIEDNVVIHAGALLFGPIVVGAGAAIGPNVWLMRDVAPSARVERSEAAA